jgi:hypothetical protein
MEDGEMAEETVTKSDRHADEQGMASHAWKRRGLLAAAWAAVAAVVVRQTTEPVQAGVDGDVVLGAANVTTEITAITNTTEGKDGLDVYCNTGDGTNGFGVYAEGTGYGLVGVHVPSGKPDGAGVFGRTNRADSSGVRGEVVGSNNGIGVYGANTSSFAGAAPGAGGFGLYGLSLKGHGLVGATATSGGAAVVGATNGVGGAYAGAFYGPVAVTGSFTVFGAKSAAVPHPDGTHRLLYCMESPESWFEDFGKGQLECGQADITIDPDFGAVVDLADYHVFLTGYDDFELRVSKQTATGFRVQAKDVASAGRFSWRVVAKRKDVVGERLAKITKPSEPRLPPPPSTDAHSASSSLGRRVRQQRVG